MTIALPSRPNILVVALRRLGDVLLTTPLIRSLRQAWPDATIDALVFSGTEGMLVGNPDIDNILIMPTRPSSRESLAFGMKLFKRYALAVSTQTGDRPSFFAIVAGRSRAGLVDPGRAGYFKQLALTRGVLAVKGVHRVEEVLRLADGLGIDRHVEVVVPQGHTRSDLVPDRPYAVIHPAPMFRYKRWHIDGWRKLADALAKRGLEVIVTGGPDPAERVYLDEVCDELPFVQRLDGKLVWHEIAALLAKANVFVGPDTSVTHLAAASGCPTVALFGPTDPRLWGPWPSGGLSSPWLAAGTIQNRGNVWLVQNPLPCLPCQEEGCDHHIDSYSQCLDELTVGHVLKAVDEAMQSLPARIGAPA